MPRPLYPRERDPVLTVQTLEKAWDRSERARKFSPHLDFVLNSFSCSVFVLFPYLFLCLDCPGLFLCLHSTTHNTNIHAPSGIRTLNPSKRAATSSRLRPRGHRLRSSSSQRVAVQTTLEKQTVQNWTATIACLPYYTNICWRFLGRGLWGE